MTLDKSSLLSQLEQTPPELTPINSFTNHRNKIPNPNIDAPTLLTHRQALRRVDVLGYSGIGFVLKPENNITFIDLDKVIIDGEISVEAKHILKKANTYAELSLSGTGIHLFGYANLDSSLRNKYNLNTGSLEVYSEKRYATLTGIPIASLPFSQLNLSELFPFLSPKSVNINSARSGEVEDDIDFHKMTITNLLHLLGKQRNQRNRNNFIKLIYGDIGGYDTQNEADLAFCRLGMYYSKSTNFLNRNFGKGLGGYDSKSIAFSLVNRIMQDSRLMRDKWLRLDYRLATMSLAYDSTLEVYGADKYFSKKQSERAYKAAHVKRQKTLTKLQTAKGKLEMRNEKVTQVALMRLTGIKKHDTIRKYIHLL